MYFGADYYPEHWPQERWSEDARLMKEAGLNVVRVGEFAWAQLEPVEGRYDFGWLDKAIDTLAEAGIKAVIGTPTATPPAWLISKYPEILPVDENGQQKGFGSRCHYCANSPVYQEYTDKIVKALATHYRDNPHVAGWQTDNEFGCHSTTRCHCPGCQKAFRQWLKDKYGDLDTLNEAWGTAFWSQVYTDWEQISTPRRTVARYGSGMQAHNPGLILDFYRFSSDSNVLYQRRQVRILRSICPDKFITHNLMGLFNEIDYYDLAADLDFISWDNYPGQISTSAVVRPAMAHDVMRSMKNTTYWVMEQQSGPGGWDVISPTPRPGDLRLWTYQSLAHGADAIVYFRWRTCRSGTEQYWHGILNHDGIPRRRYLEVQKTGQELQRIGDEIAGSRYQAGVGMLWSYESNWSLQIQPAAPGLSYTRIASSLYRAFHRQHIPVDFVPETADLSSYRLMVAPALHIVDEETAGRLRDFAAGGGILVTTFRSGVRDRTNKITDQPLPGLLAELAGVTCVDYTSVPGDQKLPVSLNANLFASTEASCGLWCDILEVNPGVEVLASFTSDWFAGKPAVTGNSFGSGKAYYVASELDARTLEQMARFWARQAGIDPLLPEPIESVEVTRRSKGDMSYWFLLNYGEDPVDVPLPEPGTDLISGREVAGLIHLGSKHVAIIRSS